MRHQWRPSAGGLVIILCGALSATAVSFGASPSAAQNTVDAIVVTGHEGGKKPRDESYSVSYADLDLRTGNGRQELNRRIKSTAGSLCHEVLDPGHSGHFVACRDQAVKDAQPKVQAAIEQAKARHGAWHAGPAWTPYSKK
jgi:UrcA family protein